MSNRSVERTEQALAAIEAAGDEGRRIFTKVYADAAREAARAADERAARGLSLGPLDGRVVSVKDLFDVAGEATTAGSAVMRHAAPAKSDALIVQRLRAGGAVIVGKTNMTEFAFSGIGINPHFGTPGNARDATRIPGGSSSGAGVAVARGMSEISIGSDTGGSVRIPSALNGITGWKPTQARVSREGAFPLSFSLDTVGPLARSVRDCVQADAVLSGESRAPAVARRSVSGLRLGIPRGLLFTQADADVLASFEALVQALSATGARVADMDLEQWMTAPFKLQERGTLIASEASHIHAATVRDHASEIDQRVLARIRAGEEIPAPYYVGLQRERARWQGLLDEQMADLDALILPTVPVVAPRIDDLQTDTELFQRTNLLVLRNPSVFNFYDLPALSLPIQTEAGELPRAVMVVGRRGGDSALLSIGVALQEQIDLLR